MTRTRSRRIPKFRIHKATGQAYVELNGHRLYLGRHDRPGARQAYDRLIAEWLRGGRQLPDEVQPLVVNELLVDFWKFAKTYYVKPDGSPTGELEAYAQVIRALRQTYGEWPAAEFGPKALRDVRERMIDRGWCRTNINRMVSRVKRLFRWGVEHEMVPGNTYHALQAVSGLRHGRSRAHESEAVKPIPNEHVEAVRPHVSRQAWAMIRLQLLTAARPGEIVTMRPGDIDTEGAVWTYAPSDHKTAHHGHVRTIYIGPRGQEALKTFLQRADTAYVFSPAEAEAERRRKLHAARVTPLNYGNRPGTNRKAKPEQQPGDRYTVDSYRRAIQRGCDLAFPVPDDIRDDAEAVKAWRKAHRWSPHRLRHNAATFLRKEFGIEAARVVLGHRSSVVTEIYAELDREKAMEAILKTG